MKNNICPKCGHSGLKAYDVMDHDTGHKTRGLECPNCGWQNY